MVLEIEVFGVPRASRDAAHHAHGHGTCLLQHRKQCYGIRDPDRDMCWCETPVMPTRMLGPIRPLGCGIIGAIILVIGNVKYAY